MSVYSCPHYIDLSIVPIVCVLKNNMAMIVWLNGFFDIFLTVSFVSGNNWPFLLIPNRRRTVALQSYYAVSRLSGNRYISFISYAIEGIYYYMLQRNEVNMFIRVFSIGPCVIACIFI